MELEDEYLRQAMKASSQQQSLPPFDPNDNDDDDELRKAIEVSEREHEIKERERQQRQESLAAEEAAQEATAIAESTRFAGTQTDAQRLEAAAEVEFERILKESAAEAEQKKAAEEEELARLHAGFGSGGGSARAGRSPRQTPTATSSSRGRQRASSDVTTRISAGEQRQRVQTATQNPTSPNPNPSTASSEEARSRGGEILNRALNSVRRPFGRSNSSSSQQPARHNAPARLGEIRPQDLPEPPTPPPALSPPRQIPHLQDRTHTDRVRPAPGPPLQMPESLSRRHSERTPAALVPIRLLSPPSPRSPARAPHREEIDAQMRQALNSSHRVARIDERYGDSHSRREDEMLRRAMEESLGDAPPPPDPSEGLLDPPPGYKDINRDKMLDPRRYTTTNEKGNEPGYMRRITPAILEVMQRWLADMERFDADWKATGKDQPPANNAFTKKRPDAEVKTAGSTGVDDLHTLLGGPRPAPAPPVQPQAVAANAFVSRMPGLATDAMTRIPTARPWDNAFSRLPTARPAARARGGVRRSGL